MPERVMGGGVMNFGIGDRVRYIPGYKGYFYAEVVGDDPPYIVIEFSSGKQISVYPDELEAA
jgi:hypothetical protein